MTDSPIDLFFAARGRATNDLPTGRPDDETLAAWLDGGLSPGQRRLLEEQALTDPALFELLRAAVDGIGASVPAAGARPFRVLANLKARGLEILNAFEVRFWALVDGDQFQPAFGPLRRDAVTAPDMLTVRGPGQGLDELDLQLQADRTTRLVVRAELAPETAADEKLSLLLESDGVLRRKLPFEASGMILTDLAAGHHVLRLVARAPGGEARELARAEIVLSDEG